MTKISMTRREICWLLPAAAMILAASAIAAAQPQEKSLPSASYPFDKLPVRKMNSGAERRDILTGKLATGESLETHETTSQPGGMPHPSHHHLNSEVWLIREGTLELTVNVNSYQLGPGSVGFVHSNEEHGVKNIGFYAGDILCSGGWPGRGLGVVARG